MMEIAHEKKKSQTKEIEIIREYVDEVKPNNLLLDPVVPRQIAKPIDFARDYSRDNARDYSREN